MVQGRMGVRGAGLVGGAGVKERWPHSSLIDPPPPPPPRIGLNIILCIPHPACCPPTLILSSLRVRVLSMKRACSEKGSTSGPWGGMLACGGGGAGQ